METYVFAILGFPTPAQKLALEESIRELIGKICPEITDKLEILDSQELTHQHFDKNFVAVYFGGKNMVHNIPQRVLDDNLLVIPIFQSNSEFDKLVPEDISQTLGIELDTENRPIEIAATMLEHAGLLNQRRKIFISYVHNDSRPIALQLYKRMTELRFDVFLDSHKIHYGEKIVEVLKRNVIESDMLVVLHTEQYPERKMTKCEFSLASLRGMSILRIVWPGTIDELPSGQIHDIILRPTDLVDCDELKKGELSMSKIEEIVSKIQMVRCKSIATQLELFYGKMDEAINQTGWVENDLDSNTPISLCLNKDGRFVHLYPISGIPTSQTMTEAINLAKRLNHDNPVLVYDSTGFQDSWKSHLIWLDERINEIDCSSVADLGEKL